MSLNPVCLVSKTKEYILDLCTDNFQADNLSFNFTPGDDFIWLSVPTGNDNDYIKFLACLEISLALHRVALRLFSGV